MTAVERRPTHWHGSCSIAGTMFGLDDPKPDEQLPDPPARRRLVVRWEEVPPEGPDSAEARAQLFLDEQRAERFILLNRWMPAVTMPF